MKQLIQNSKTGELKVMNVPDPQCNDNGVLVKTLHSVISTGTERLSTQTAKASMIGKARLRPDLVEKVYNHYKKHGFRSFRCTYAIRLLMFWLYYRGRL